MFDIRKFKAIQSKFEKEYKDIPHTSGIYLWTRQEDNITYFYIGQAEDLNKRRFDYWRLEKKLTYPTRHFEASLIKHKDWVYQIKELCSKDKLNEREKYWIDYYNALPNHITRNTAIAGQDIVQSNAKRIDRVLNRYKNKLNKYIENLDVQINKDNIIIKIKKLKDGKTNAKISEAAFNELIGEFKSENVKKNKNFQKF